VLDQWSSRLHPDDAERIFAAVRQHHDNRTTYDVEYRLKVKSGTYRWFQARAKSIWDDNGRATRMAGSIRDITDQKNAERNLRAASARTEAILANIADMIVVINEAGTVQSFNRAAERAFGYYTHEVVGKT